MSSFSLDVETDRDAILEAFRDELIDAVEQGPESVEKTLAAWCAWYPERDDTFRKEARAILLLWGLREPERLGPYQLLDVLTIGGMGKIYRAREDVTGRVVAVKTVLAGHLSPAEQMERFDTERRLLSRLHDTHIVPLLATGQEGYLLYLVMPFISGVTLHSVIDTGSGRASTAGAVPDLRVAFQRGVESRIDETEGPRRRIPINRIPGRRQRLPRTFVPLSRAGTVGPPTTSAASSRSWSTWAAPSSTSTTRRSFTAI